MAPSVASNQDSSKHEMIVAVVPASDRSKTCYDLYQMCQEAISRSGTCSAIWRKKSILTYTTTDVDFATTPAASTSASNNLSHLGNSQREKLDLMFQST
jgi:hypothetical protein